MVGYKEGVHVWLGVFFALFSVISFLARRLGYSFTIWAVVGLQMVFYIFWNTSFGLCILSDGRTFY